MREVILDQRSIVSLVELLICEQGYAITLNRCRAENGSRSAGNFASM